MLLPILIKCYFLFFFNKFYVILLEFCFRNYNISNTSFSKRVDTGRNRHEQIYYVRPERERKTNRDEEKDKQRWRERQREMERKTKIDGEMDV